MSIIWDEGPHQRGIFCNRTLNLRSIQAIGYDMDYTLIQYNWTKWEGRAYDHIKIGLLADGWPIEDLEFEPDWVMRGLVLDKELGNIVKANRFGYVKQACHGTKMLDHSEVKKIYSRTVVDLSESRFFFINSLFSMSEACIYSQLVDLLDQKKIPEILGYEDLYIRVRATLDLAHIEGELKDGVMSNPEEYVEVDEELPLALLDQREAGKKLLLITNSNWAYTQCMMNYAFDPYLPKGMTWQDIFHLVVVSAQKPSFFEQRKPMFKIVNEEGLLQPCPRGPLEDGMYLGGSASQIETYLGLSGGELLYVGDHIYADVSVSKDVLRWRTALIVPEIEDEIKAIEEGQENQQKIRELMKKKVKLENQFSQIRLELLRNQRSYGPKTKAKAKGLQGKMTKLRNQLVEIDKQIAPLNVGDGRSYNPHWGFLMRAGNDKSRITRQIEKYADIYTSRVSNFLQYTPFMYFRSPRGSLPHDQG